MIIPSSVDNPGTLSHGSAEVLVTMSNQPASRLWFKSEKKQDEGVLFMGSAHQKIPLLKQTELTARIS